MLGCCFVVQRLCYVSARGMCGCRCGAVRRCPGKCVVWRGCGVRLLVGGCPSRRCRPWVWFGLWPVVGVEQACGVWGFQGRCRWGGGVGCRAGVAWRRSCVGRLWCFRSSGGGGGCGVAWWYWAAWWPSRWGGGGACPGLVVGRCGAALCGLLVVLLVCFGTSAVWVRCGVGLGVPWGGVCGIGLSQPGACGLVVLGVVGLPVSGPSGAGSAVYGPHAGCHVCGVCGLVGRGGVGVLRPQCGVRGWEVVVRGPGVPSPWQGGGCWLRCGVGPW